MNTDGFQIVQLDARYEPQVRQLARSAQFAKKSTWTKTPEDMMAGELVTGERKALAVLDESGRIVSYLDYKIKRRGAIGIGFCVTLEEYRGQGLMDRLFARLVANYPQREITVGTSEHNASMRRVVEAHGFVLIGKKQDREGDQHTLYYQRNGTEMQAEEEPIPEAVSGPEWVAFFPTSVSTSDLIPSFRDNTDRFLAALTQAGASFRINATYRPPERAYLMHYAYRIAREGLDPSKARTFWGLPIRWLHTDGYGRPDVEASVRAAEAMVRAYGIAYAPAMYSRHTEGRAIDVTITWEGVLQIYDGSGNVVEIATEPRNGGGNRLLHEVGASYGVIKLVGDAPHWSDDGQ